MRSLLAPHWIFDAGARFYAWFNAQESWRQSCARLAEHFPALERSGDKLLVLDLGCGPGVTAIELARQRPDAQIIGLDLAPRMLAEARKYTAAADLTGKIDYVLADATRLPIAGDSLHMATGHSFLYLVGDRRGVLAEAYRVLRRGGRFASMEPHGGRANWAAMLASHWHDLRVMISLVLWRPYSRLHGQFTDDNFRALLADAGFVNYSSELTLHGLGIIGRGEK